jgi:transposase
VVAGIETDRGLRVAALTAAGYLILAVNPLQAARFRDRHGVPGAKSDAGDAHALAGMVRTGSHQLRPAAGDSPEAEGIKVLARTHKTMIRERTREVQRPVRPQLLEYFPAALEAFDDLDAPGTLELLGKAPEPARAAKLAARRSPRCLSGPGRRDITGRATATGRPAQRAARPAAGPHPGLRRHGLVAGGGPFWPVPGRVTKPFSRECLDTRAEPPHRRGR